MLDSAIRAALSVSLIASVDHRQAAVLISKLCLFVGHCVIHAAVDCADAPVEAAGGHQLDGRLVQSPP